MCVGSTSSADTAAFGFPVRNGSMRMRVSPSLSSKQAWPRKRMSKVISSGSIVGLQFSGELPPDGDAHQHPYTRLLGEEGPNGANALVGVGHGRHAQDLALVRLAEPAAGVERLDEDALKLRRDAGDSGLGRAEAHRVAERLDRSLDLRLRELAPGRPAHKRWVHLPPRPQGAGAAAKTPPGALHPLLAELPRSSDPAL